MCTSLLTQADICAGAVSCGQANAWRLQIRVATRVCVKHGQCLVMGLTHIGVLMVHGCMAGAAAEVLKPTWRMLPGVSTKSLALQAALKEGISPGIVDRARHFLQVAARC